MKYSIEDWVTLRTKDLKCELFKKYSVLYTCAEKNDDRDNEILKYLSDQVIIHNVFYSIDNAEVNIDNVSYNIMNIDSYKVPVGNILVDATILSLPEILHLYRIFHLHKKEFDVIYVQPDSYKSKGDLTGKDDSHKFDLSFDGAGLQSVPPYVGITQNASTLISLGFEGERVGALINSDEFNIEDVKCIVGIPAFKIGWENHMFSNNYQELSKMSREVENFTLEVCGANDPIKTYEILDELYSSCQYAKKTLCLIPLGTKPNTIAICLFAINNPHVVIIYDFIIKKRKRTKGADLVHIWGVKKS